MKILIASLILSLGLQAATALPRGSGIRGEVGASRRKLQNMGGMDKNDDKNDNKNDKDGAAGAADEDREEAVPVALVEETHPCSEAQTAIDYVGQWGHPDQGDMDCYLDPENACNGGCCRFAQWFICDEDDSAPSMPCVCNQNTAEVVVFVPDPVESGNVTESINMTVADAPTVTPLTQEMLEEEFPDIAALLSAQEAAPPPPGSMADEDDMESASKDERNIDINVFD